MGAARGRVPRPGIGELGPANRLALVPAARTRRGTATEPNPPTERFQVDVGAAIAKGGDDAPPPAKVRPVGGNMVSHRRCHNTVHGATCRPFIVELTAMRSPSAIAWWMS